ncbi:MAG: nucleotidyl transferase AbiEii/AbiGii toxin family protein, partial [Anaerolineaceae bacterium]
WILKGGLALQLRLRDRARTTKDIDLLFLVEPNRVLGFLRDAVALDLGDWFTFEVGQPSGAPEQTGGGIRHTVHSLLDGRTFERFHIDVGTGDPLVEAAEYLTMPNLLSFAEIEPVIVPCYPISQQLAEKIHAYTKPHVSGASSRIKDFVDMILLAELGEISGQILTAAIEATFRSAGDEDIPQMVPPPPRMWEGGFRRLANEVGLSDYSLESSYARIQRFFDPILRGEARGLHWNPESWSWK